MIRRNVIFTVIFILSAGIGFFVNLSQTNSLHLVFFKKIDNATLVKQVIIPIPVKVPIVIYHSVRPYTKGESKEQDLFDITPELLAEQLSYLKLQGFTTISFEMLADYFDTGKPLPVKPIILSFDDAWENQYTYAFPLLVKQKMTGTFFVFTNSLNRGTHLRWDDVRTMRKAGMEIGSHTKFHPFLDDIKSPTLLANEIEGSKIILEESVGTTTAFAYPFGEHGTTTVNEVKHAGYRVARAIRGGNVQSIEDRYTLRGFLVSDSLAEFKRMINK